MDFVEALSRLTEVMSRRGWLRREDITVVVPDLLPIAAHFSVQKYFLADSYSVNEKNEIEAAYFETQFATVRVIEDKSGNKRRKEDQDNLRTN